jgi:hypothetical protein
MKHNWQVIAPPEDMGVMCSECYQCKCCGPYTEDCKGYTDEEWFKSVIVEEN